MVIRRRSLLLAGVAVPAAAASARAQCVTDTPAVDACRGGVRITSPPGATLDLSFYGPTLDPSLTFTRASTATYFDSSGVMRIAAMNLMLWSANVANAAWINSGGPTITANATTAPDGTVTAARVDFVAISTAPNSCQVGQSLTATAVPYTLSVYVKGNAGGEQMYLMITPNGSLYYSVPITLTTAWQRFTLTTPALTAATWFWQLGVDMRDATQTAKPAQTAFVWGGQFEAGIAATPYIPTTSAPNGAPRFDYDPVTHVALGLLIEEQRTNGVRNGNATGAVVGTPGTMPTNWSMSVGATTLSTQVVGTGTESGIPYVDWRIFGTPAATAGPVIIAEDNLLVAATGQAWTSSAYWRVAAGSVAGFASFQVVIREYTTPGVFVKDTTTGVAAPASAALASQRLVVSSTLSGGATTGMVQARYVLNVTNGVPVDLTLRIGGVQMEQGAFPTSYIPTTAAAVTRSSDLCTIQPANIGFFVSPGGSWMAEFIPFAYMSDYQRVVFALPAPNGAAPVLMDISRHGGQYDGTGLPATANTVTIGAITRIATTATASVGNVCLNGGAVASAAMGGAYPMIATNGIGLMVGTGAGATLNTDGYIRRVRYWPRVLSNSELQSVTR